MLCVSKENKKIKENKHFRHFLYAKVDIIVQSY